MKEAKPVVVHRPIGYIRIPLGWLIWRTIIGGFDLDDERPLDEWFVIIDTFIKLGWDDPANQALYDANTFNAAANKHAANEFAYQVWGGAVLVYSDTTSGVCMALKGSSSASEALLNRIKSVALSGSSIRDAVSNSTARAKTLKLPGPASDGKAGQTSPT